MNKLALQNTGAGAGALTVGVLLFGQANGWWIVDNATMGALPLGLSWLINKAFNIGRKNPSIEED